MNLFDVLASGFPSDKRACALETHDGLYYSWQDLEQATNKLANLLADLHLPAGSRVAAQVEKSPEALFLYLATLKAGLVYLPLNTAYQAAEIGYFLENAEPAVVVCSPASHGWIAPLAKASGAKEVFTLSDQRTGTLLDAAATKPTHFQTVARGDQDLAAILYTSGTTGRSKGAMLTHKNLASNAQVLQKFWHWQRGDVLLHALPIFHVHGLFVGCHGALINGSKMIWLPRLDVKALMLGLPKATVMMGVPTFYVRLLAEPEFGRETCRNMRLFVSGSAPMLTETFVQFQDRTGHTILERYGMSETVMLTSNPYEGLRMGGSVGLPLPGTDIRVVDADGRICGAKEVGGVQVKGPQVFQGYWRLPEKTKEEFTADGWFKTGDMGRWGGETSAGTAPDDYLCLVGRSKDLIITGGYNVYPKEIESFIDDIDGVEESAVIGIPHPDFGEAVVAVVVAKPKAALNAEAMIAELKAKIANYKVPKRLVIVDDLPRNAMGKVLKNVLREQYAS